MDTKNFKKAIMKLNTKRRDDIQEVYTHKFKENQLKVQLQEKDEQIKANEDHILLLKDLLIDDQKREKTQVIYIATSKITPGKTASNQEASKVQINRPLGSLLTTVVQQQATSGITPILFWWPIIGKSRTV